MEVLRKAAGKVFTHGPAGKTALITGGAHRLGRAITMALAGAGCNVVVNYHRSRGAAEATAAEAHALDVQSIPWQADVANHEQVEAMAGSRSGSVLAGSTSWSTAHRTSK